MKILREFVMPDDNLVENYLVESKDGNEKDIYIKGIFGQSEIKNRNGRIYPLEYMLRECYKLQKKIASPQMLVGELDHPNSPEYNLRNAAIRIISYKQDQNNPNNFLGEAKILKDTACGKTAYGLAKEGIKFGISSRALGSLSENNGNMYVNEDLNMLTYDVVSDPSAPDAWVESVLAEKEWLFDGEYIKEDVVATYKNKIKSLPKPEIKEGITKLFKEFLNEI